MRVLVGRHARGEMRRALEYHAAVSPGVGAGFAAELEAALRKIGEAPLTWSPYSDRTRRYLIDRYRHAEIYRVEADVVRVLAVTHQRRHPDYWRGR